MDLLLIKLNDLKRTEEETCDKDYYSRLAHIEEIAWEIKNDKNASNEIRQKAFAIIKDIHEKFYDSEKLVNYVYTFCRTTYPTYYKTHKDDLTQSAFEELFKNTRHYNGKHELTTFANVHLRHGIQNYISHISRKTPYENEIYNKVRKERDRLISLGYEPSEITVSMLAENLPDLTQTQIAQSLERENCTQVEGYNADVLKTAVFDTPEQQALHQENVDLLNEILSALTPYERYALLAVNGELEAKKMTYQELGSDERFISLLKEYGLGHMISSNGSVAKDKVKKIYERTLLHAQNVPAAAKRNRETMVAISNSYCERIDFEAKQAAEENELLLYDIMTKN